MLGELREEEALALAQPLAAHGLLLSDVRRPRSIGVLPVVTDAAHVARYPLERLSADQEYDWVADAITPALAWVPGKGKAKQTHPFRFPLEHLADASEEHGRLRLAPGVPIRACRTPRARLHRSAHRRGGARRGPFAAGARLA
ncbi:MAG: hypothetical protein M5U28_36400 [Sandaracinaceae bacterium]|nr:hypothetical protein [Sandaracinaceae bacterium]